MFILNLTYVKPLSEIDRLIPAHITYLKEHYASGQFLFSGRREPRTGGVIVARAGSLAEVQGIIAEDPFLREGVAEYDIVEFLPSMTAPDLAGFKEV
ncbi:MULTISPECIES: YciI family protein [unclassified Pseudodesulfovibrio]|uniref:YciI family protein n=1 Tax=unclassified Pseudodesulfovibrio TaxID=2661612 RepID=UPI000FEB70EF|nr:MULTISPECIES: YciI family protein [unclassified Pseudodesulfovibrio]MCJ2165654.1 YciI family protein [Pseudodesulfovibrio sp. S3-i]RWU02920.1 GTP cyclohydrolase [Pseudodesulfovibrio sp. S3]